MRLRFPKTRPGDYRDWLTIASCLLCVTTALAASAVMVVLLASRATTLSQQRIRTASNIGYTLIVQDKDRNLGNAELIASRTFVQDAVANATAVTLQNELLEPYRVTMQLDFISVLDANNKPIGEARRLMPPALSSLSLARSVVSSGRSASGIIDTDDRTWILAAAPIVRDNRTTGLVAVGRAMDDGYLNTLSGRLGGYEAGLLQKGTLTAVSSGLRNAETRQQITKPVTPKVISQNGSFQSWRLGSDRFDSINRGIGWGSQATLVLAQPHDDDTLLPPVVRQRAFWSVALIVLVSIIMARILVWLCLAPLRQLTPMLEQAAGTPSAVAVRLVPPGTGQLGAAVGRLLAHTSDVEAELVEQRASLFAILNSMPVGIVMSDAEGGVSFTNTTARDLLGLHSEPAETVAAQLTGGQNGIQTLQGRNGRVLAAATATVADLRENVATGRPLTLVTVLQDVTHEQQLEQMRADFLSTISHELRTPLTAVKSSVDLLLEGDAGELTSTQQRFLQTVRRNSERLIGLVSELLDLSRIESGQVQLTLHPIDARRVVDDVTSSLSNLFESKHQEVDLELPPDPVLVQADRRRFEQVMTNLLANAGIYTPEGGHIRVSAGYDSAQDWAEIRVENDGPGIPFEDQPRIFDKFFRGGHALTRRDGGTGLGLAIVKSLVDLHHGKVSVKSDPDEGTCFTVTLPRPPGEEHAHPTR